MAWAKTVIANHIKDRYRRASVQLKNQGKLYFPQDDPGEDVLDAMLARQAFSFIKDLKPRDHEIAVMYFIENLEPRDIARILGRNVVTVRGSLHRTRKEIRKRLGIVVEAQRTISRETT